VIPLIDLKLELHNYLPPLAFCTGSIVWLHHLVGSRSMFRRNAVNGGWCLIDTEQIVQKAVSADLMDRTGDATCRY
jgi:hypothetical protein